MEIRQHSGFYEKHFMHGAFPLKHFHLYFYDKYDKDVDALKIAAAVVVEVDGIGADLG